VPYATHRLGGVEAICALVRRVLGEAVEVEHVDGGLLGVLAILADLGYWEIIPHRQEVKA
jgi:hypothetical protein